MAPSTSSLLLTLYISCETVRANYAYHAFHTYPQISASLINLLSETLKFLLALFFILKANAGFTLPGFKKCLLALREGETLDFRRILKYALPAGLYLANNLIYYTVLPKTSPSLLQVCVLMKLPTTGVLHHYVIKPQRNPYAWTSLGCLCVGLVVFNVPSSSSLKGGKGDRSGSATPSWILAPVAGFAIACLSAMASIATETSTKMGEFWESQMYLYTWGVLFSIIALPLAPSGKSFSEAGSTAFEFVATVLGLVVITSGTGIVVAVVLRARDNILKLIGTASSLITIAASQFILLPQLRAETFTPWRVCGGGIVTVATWCYNHYSQEAWKEGSPMRASDVENEGLLDAEGLEKEGGESSEEVVKDDGGEEKVLLLRPTAGKIICCALVVALATFEVALRT
ncbi:hypothetical protein HYALB_00001978 [Hymenoscyphus albidus]|uniref:Uncharacterized protein n=1 Tax=Hymenoscyphus albidus TaxID=595503 RepID=A0A9N9Q391_9HELO|nr:hypothetical protein HYALB_00001978 [Hymenoscyphus albidus]